MCMNCGCGQVNERHKKGDITLDDMHQAAANHDMDVEQAAENIHDSATQPKHEGMGRMS